MSKAIKIFLVFSAVFFLQKINAQIKINGTITDKATGLPIANANVKNIYTQAGMSTDSSGQFTILCKPGQLVEISHIAYNTLRVRIQSVTEPLYYNLVLQPKSKKLQEVIIRDKSNNYLLDSIENEETYHTILQQPTFSDYTLGAGIVAMASKSQRQKWDFIAMYNKWQQDKYVDYYFNEKKIAKWTKMPPEKLQTFMQLYRPSYEFVRSVNQYVLLKYIKESVASFCPTCTFDTN